MSLAMNTYTLKWLSQLVAGSFKVLLTQRVTPNPKF